MVRSMVGVAGGQILGSCPGMIVLCAHIQTLQAQTQTQTWKRPLGQNVTDNTSTPGRWEANEEEKKNGDERHRGRPTLHGATYIHGLARFIELAFYSST